MQHCKLTLVCNAGVVLEMGRTVIWSDVLHNDKAPRFSSVTPELADRVIDGGAVPQPDPIFEKQRQRMHYDPKVDHIDAADPRMMREILPEHFVYCNAPEFERYKTML